MENALGKSHKVTSPPLQEPPGGSPRLLPVRTLRGLPWAEPTEVGGPLAISHPQVIRVQPPSFVRIGTEASLSVFGASGRGSRSLVSAAILLISVPPDCGWHVVLPPPFSDGSRKVIGFQFVQLFFSL